MKLNTMNSVHHLWYLVSHTLLAKGLNQGARDLKMSQPLIFSIANLTLLVNISKFSK